MCTCIETSENKLIEHLKSKGQNVVDGEFQNKPALMFGTNTIKLFSPFKYTYTFKKKNGIDSKQRTNTVNVFYNYCPFCGLKYE